MGIDSKAIVLYSYRYGNFHSILVLHQFDGLCLSSALSILCQLLATVAFSLSLMSVVPVLMSHNYYLNPGTDNILVISSIHDQLP